jgi:coproporphyrinogen III oxidase-like Fe-S oxidoreductase
VEETETLDAQALALEVLMTGLRTYAGADLARVRRCWGIDIRATNADRIDQLAAEGLARMVGDRLVPTADGLAVADGMAADFDLAG